MIPKKDHIFHGPDGQGYRVTRDCFLGDPVTPDLFEPIGGAPHQGAGGLITPWLAAQLAAK